MNRRGISVSFYRVMLFVTERKRPNAEENSTMRMAQVSHDHIHHLSLSLSVSRACARGKPTHVHTDTHIHMQTHTHTHQCTNIPPFSLSQNKTRNISLSFYIVKAQRFYCILALLRRRLRLSARAILPFRLILIPRLPLTLPFRPPPRELARQRRRCSRLTTRESLRACLRWALVSPLVRGSWYSSTTARLSSRNT